MTPATGKDGDQIHADTGSGAVISPMTDPDHRRRCRFCRTHLARDNATSVCGPCRLAGHQYAPIAPTVPPDFWRDEALQEAFQQRHMGLVIRAYRRHRHHGRRGLAQHEVAAWAGVGQTQLSRLETGPPLLRLDQLIYWAQLLQIPEHYLWFKLPDEVASGDGPPQTAGSAFLPVIGGGGLGLEVHSDPLGLGPPPGTSVARILDGAQRTPLPVRITPLEIEQITNVASFFESWDFTYGGGVIREAVMAQLRWSTGLLDASCPAAHRAELFSAVGYLAHVCGFMAFDDLAGDDARRAWRLALACAEEAGDWPLRANALASMARQAMWVEQLDEALTLAELALVRSDRLTPVEQAMLHGTKARALAAMGQVPATLTTVDLADRHFAEVREDEVPPLLAYYDEAEHAGDTGHALADLVVFDGQRLAAARERLALAAATHTPAFARSEAFCQTRLATLTMAASEPQEAARLGRAASNLASGIRSRRLDHYFEELTTEAQPYAAVAEVGELQERLQAVRPA